MKLLLLLAGFLLIVGCNKQDPQYSFEQEDIETEGLSFDQDSILAAVPSVFLKLSEIVFEDGETIEAFLKRYNPNSKPLLSQKSLSSNQEDDRPSTVAYRTFVTKIAEAGIAISGNTTVFEAEGTDGERPRQIGYAYVHNGNPSFQIRKQAGNCELYLYGIDCSGFVMYMMEKAGVNFNNNRLNVASLIKPKIINPLLQNSPLKDYQYDDYKQIPISEIKSGDLIYFKKIIFKPRPKGKKVPKEILKITDNINHIGIAARKLNNDTVFIFQSNGAIDSPDCYNAFRPGRGPRCVPINKFLTTIDWSQYGVLRLVRKKESTDLIGNWRLIKEKTEVIAGKRRFLAKSVNLQNIRISVPDISSFHIDADDPDDPNTPFSESGNYSLSKDNTDITFSGFEMYERDPINAKILALTDKKFTIEFLLIETGFTQVSTLYFEKY